MRSGGQRHLAGQRSAAVPVTFSGMPGLFEPAGTEARGVAVLFVSPWGLEELCTHKFWRVLAEQLADAGIASLRFDLPGTGDALDLDDPAIGVQAWLDAIVKAAAELRRLSGCDRIAILSQGLGGLLSLHVAERVEGLEGLACLGPVISGRAYLRELQIWSRVVDEGLGLREEDRIRDQVSIAGFRMPDAIAADIKKLVVPTLQAPPAAHVLLVHRPDRPAEAELGQALTAAGAVVTLRDYVGYDAFVSNPLISVLPLEVAEDILRWVTGLPAASGSRSSSPAPLAPAAALVGLGFLETPVRFGANDRLFGVLCEPQGPRSGATALILGTAYDRSTGWGGCGVELARKLAQAGIASLRFDAANVGDSPPVPGVPTQVLYHEAQLVDVIAALDFLETRALLPAVVSGRCSGSYLAFRSAVADRRIHGLVAANPYAFLWDKRVDVDAILHGGPRQLHEYRERMFQLATVKRLIKGQIDIRAAGINVLKSVGRRLGRHLLPVLRLLPGSGDAHRWIMKAFRDLAERKAPFELIYSEQDIGLIHFSEYFGKSGGGLARFPNVRLTMLADTDHNLTPPAARQVFFEAVKSVARKAPAN
ncbi:alpha/beta hydrolase [Rhizobium sp. RU36D]|uniref:alpha/beta hydrolase n=1 Tax=Rhizobium sp. RU36D TaxID=1907415 RepID=UPI001FCD6578|nr:alpha/beta hydrolase [Rhizobium sp. RU36D]